MLEISTSADKGYYVEDDSCDRIMEDIDIIEEEDPYDDYDYMY